MNIDHKNEYKRNNWARVFQVNQDELEKAKRKAIPQVKNATPVEQVELSQQEPFVSLDLSDYRPLLTAVLLPLQQSKLLKSLENVDVDQSKSSLLDFIDDLMVTIKKDNTIDSGYISAVSTKFNQYLADNQQTSNKDILEALKKNVVDSFTDYMTEEVTFGSDLTRGVYVAKNNVRKRLRDSYVFDEPTVRGKFSQAFQNHKEQELFFSMYANQKAMLGAIDFGRIHSTATKLKYTPDQGEQRYVIQPSADNDGSFSFELTLPIHRFKDAGETTNNSEDYRDKLAGLVKVKLKLTPQDKANDDVFHPKLKHLAVEVEEAYKEIYDEKYNLAERNVLLAKLFDNILTNQTSGQNYLAAKDYLLQQFTSYRKWPEQEYSLYQHFKKIERLAPAGETDQEVKAHCAQQLLLLAYYNSEIAVRLFKDYGDDHYPVMQKRFLDMIAQLPSANDMLEKLRTQHSFDTQTSLAVRDFKDCLSYVDNGHWNEVIHALYNQKNVADSSSKEKLKSRRLQYNRRHFMLAALTRITSPEQAEIALGYDLIRDNLDQGTLQHLVIVSGSKSWLLDRIERPNVWQRFVNWLNRSKSSIYTVTEKTPQVNEFAQSWTRLLNGYSEFLEYYSRGPNLGHDNDAIVVLLQRLMKNDSYADYCDVLEKHFSGTDDNFKNKIAQLADNLKEMAQEFDLGTSHADNPEGVKRIIKNLQRKDSATQIALHRLKGDVNDRLLIQSILADDKARGFIDAPTWLHFLAIAPKEAQPYFNADKKRRAMCDAWQKHNSQRFNQFERFEQLKRNPNLWKTVYAKPFRLFVWLGLAKDPRKDISLDNIYSLLMLKGNDEYSKSVAKAHRKAILDDSATVKRLKYLSPVRAAKLLTHLGRDYPFAKLDKKDKYLFRLLRQAPDWAIETYMQSWMKRVFATQNDIKLKDKHSEIKKVFKAVFDPESSLAKPEIAGNVFLNTLSQSDNALEVYQALRAKFGASDEWASLKTLLMTDGNEETLLAFCNAVVVDEAAVHELHDKDSDLAKHCFDFLFEKLKGKRSTEQLPFDAKIISNLLLLQKPEFNKPEFGSLLAQLLIHHDGMINLFVKLDSAVVDVALRKMLRYLDADNKRLLQLKLSQTQQHSKTVIAEHNKGDELLSLLEKKLSVHNHDIKKQYWFNLYLAVKSGKAVTDKSLNGEKGASLEAILVEKIVNETKAIANDESNLQEFQKQYAKMQQAATLQREIENTVDTMLTVMGSCDKKVYANDNDKTLANAINDPAVLRELIADMPKMTALLASKDLDLTLAAEFVAMLPSDYNFILEQWLPLLDRFVADQNLMFTNWIYDALDQHFLKSDAATLKEQFDAWVYSKHAAGKFDITDALKARLNTIVERKTFRGKDYAKVLLSDGDYENSQLRQDLIRDSELRRLVFQRYRDSASTEQMVDIIVRESALKDDRAIIDLLIAKPIIDLIIQESNSVQLLALLQAQPELLNDVIDHYMENSQVREQVNAHDELKFKMINLAKGRVPELVLTSDFFFQQAILSEDTMNAFFKYANNDQIIDLLLHPDIKDQLFRVASVDDSKCIQNLRGKVDDSEFATNLLFGQTSSNQLIEILPKLIKFQERRIELGSGEAPPEFALSYVMSRFMGRVNRSQASTDGRTNGSNTAQFDLLLEQASAEQIFNLFHECREMLKTNPGVRPDKQARSVFTGMLDLQGVFRSSGLRSEVVIDKLLFGCNQQQFEYILKNDFGDLNGKNSHINRRVIQHLFEIKDLEKSQKLKAMLKRCDGDFLKEYLARIPTKFSLSLWPEFDEAQRNAVYVGDEAPVRVHEKVPTQDQFVFTCLAEILKDEKAFKRKLCRDSDFAIRFIDDSADPKHVKLISVGEHADNEFIFVANNANIPSQYLECLMFTYKAYLREHDQFFKDFMSKFKPYLDDQSPIPKFKYLDDSLHNGSSLERFHSDLIKYASVQRGDGFWFNLFEHHPEFTVNLKDSNSSPEQSHELTLAYMYYLVTNPEFCHYYFSNNFKVVDKNSRKFEIITQNGGAVSTKEHDLLCHCSAYIKDFDTVLHTALGYVGSDSSPRSFHNKVSLADRKNKSPFFSRAVSSSETSSSFQAEEEQKQPHPVK